MTETKHDIEPFPFFPYTAIVDRPKLTWPGGARVALWIVPNVEHFHVEIGPGAPDVRNHSRRDFQMQHRRHADRDEIGSLVLKQALQVGVSAGPVGSSARMHGGDASGVGIGNGD